MFAFVSAILIVAGLYFHDTQTVNYFLAAGLFAIASAIDSINLILEDDDDGNDKRNK